MTDDNPTEDRQRSPSKATATWGGVAMMETIEVRDITDCFNYRLGEMKIWVKGGEPMTMSIERSGILF